MPGLQFTKQFDIKLYYEELVSKYKELERKAELKQHGNQQHADPLHLYFIHNARAWGLLKESHLNAVFIDKLLIILAHEFLLYEMKLIEITLEKLCNYLMVEYKKANLNYIRKEIKAVTTYLIEKQFIEDLTIKNSVLKIRLATLFITEMREKRLITQIDRNTFSLSSDTYKIARIIQFFRNNLKIKELSGSIIEAYITDSNISRKRKKIIDFKQRLF